MTIENHPLQPFLPSNARVLMLGSFPPPRVRWCMDFFYPNYINDMWRVMGHIFFADRLHFVDEAHRTFRLNLIVPFLEEKGIALYDTATSVRRLKDNASDKFLEITESTDIAALTSRLPQLQAIVTTG
ncbi:MAG: uracil-DNA glycosylase family protein, partial [Alloprevotella sp.]|nr:uracil-DNA glycosylase family protein [Alloprevotella sp.]